MDGWGRAGWLLVVAAFMACGDGVPESGLLPWDAGPPPARDGGGTDGGGTDGGGVRPPRAGGTGTFATDGVYLHGTLAEGACYRDALAAPATPDDPHVGFDCDARDLALRSDGRVLYRHDAGGVSEVRLFGADPLTWEMDTYVYPEDPLANDPVLSDACDDVAFFVPHPTDGSFVYACPGAGSACPARSETGVCTYHSSAGGTVDLPAGTGLVALGPAGQVLFEDFRPTAPSHFAVRDADGAVVHFDVPDRTGGVQHVRALADGFHLLFTRPAALWRVSYAGDVSSLGAYPPAGDLQIYDDCALEADLDAVCIARDAEAEDLIVRLVLRAPAPEVIYDERADPLVKIHISFVFAGS